MTKTYLSLAILLISSILSLPTYSIEEKIQCYKHLSQIDRKQNILMKNLYNEAILNDGPILSNFYKNFKTNLPLSSEDQTNIRLMYIGLVRDGVVCKKLKINKNYNLESIALDIKSLISTS